MPFYSDDPAADFAAYDHYQEQQYKRLPVCEGRKCKRVIDDEFYYEDEGEILCERCFLRRHRKYVEDYING